MSLIRRLGEFINLSDADRYELAQLTCQPRHTIHARHDLISEGDAPRSLFLILEGWGCHYRDLQDGRRQIVDFAIPGDLCDLNLFILDKMDHSIGAITRMKVVEISRAVMNRIFVERPNITTALWWQELVSKSIHREWILNVGQRTAIERIAHLFCEMSLRMKSAGLAEGLSCDFPATQGDIADATGLTSVHVNRTIQELRRSGLVSLERQTLTIHDMVAVQSVAKFNADYLHQRRHSKQATSAETPERALVDGPELLVKFAN